MPRKDIGGRRAGCTRLGAVILSERRAIRTTTMRTSVTSPLQIAVVPVPGSSGLIGLSLCPGKLDRLAGWRRDLEIDVAAIRAWGAEIVVTLVEDHELKYWRSRPYRRRAARHGMRWFHLPIRDVSVPDAAFGQRWRTAGATLRSTLRRDGRVFVHCRGGLGRAGMISARILVSWACRPSWRSRRCAARPQPWRDRDPRAGRSRSRLPTGDR